jgi:hypothetical protein
VEEKGGSIKRKGEKMKKRIGRERARRDSRIRKKMCTFRNFFSILHLLSHHHTTSHFCSQTDLDKDEDPQEESQEVVKKERVGRRVVGEVRRRGEKRRKRG